MELSAPSFWPPTDYFEGSLEELDYVMHAGCSVGNWQHQSNN